MIDYLMQQLSKELQITPPLKPQVPGTYILPLETFDIKISAGQLQGVILSANLGSFPQNQEEEFFTSLLRYNLFGDSTNGAILGLSSDGGSMTLTQEITQNLDYNEFKDIMEDFINTATFWNQEAQEQIKAQPAKK